MKYFPEKKAELTAPYDLEKVRAMLAQATAEKHQKDPVAERKPFFGKVEDSLLKIFPNLNSRGLYSPTLEGKLTEVTESRPAEEGVRDMKRFTRVDLNLKTRPAAKIFSVIWLVLCVAVLGLAIWYCFKKGFDNRWWTLLIGPALLIIERIVCGIGFGVNARKALNMLKKLVK